MAPLIGNKQGRDSKASAGQSSGATPPAKRLASGLFSMGRSDVDVIAPFAAGVVIDETRPRFQRARGRRGRGNRVSRILDSNFTENADVLPPVDEEDDDVQTEEEQ